MTTFSFLDDYSEGAHPDILHVLTESNYIQQAPYGEDVYSAEATTRIKACLGDTFGGAIHYVASGTMANIVSISSCLRPHEAVIAVNSGHIVVREAGAIEATGHKLIVVPAVDGKLTRANIEDALASNAHFPHMAKPRLIYLSNATETGTVYYPCGTAEAYRHSPSNVASFYFSMARGWARPWRRATATRHWPILLPSSTFSGSVEPR